MGVSQASIAAIVSTHSRPKAAGQVLSIFVLYTHRFNTQPPEGGWMMNNMIWVKIKGFQHTAARRRLADSVA